MMSMMMLMMLLVGGGTDQFGDLLDFTDSDAYWEMRDQRVIDLDTMSAALADEDATATDTLMAIRSIGEWVLIQEADPDIKADPADKIKAIKILTPFVGSEEHFVDRYAKRSIAWIKGEVPQGYAPLPDEVYDLDLSLMPSDSTLVGQLKMANSSGPIHLASLIPDIKIEGQSMREQLVSQITPGLMHAVQMIGNARVDLITAGTALQDMNTSVMVIAIRGQYDRVGVMMALEEEIGDEEGWSFYSVGDVEVIANPDAGDPIAMLMPSDELFVFMFTERRSTKLPIDDIANKLQQPDRKPAFSDELTKQIAAIDRKKADVWAAMQITPAMKEEPELDAALGAFDAARATAVRDTEGIFDIQWVGEGRNEDLIEKTAAHLAGQVNQGIAEIAKSKQQMPQEMRVLMDPIVEMMESIKLKADGKTMTGGMKIDPKVGMSFPMMMFGMNTRPEHGRAIEREFLIEGAVLEAAEAVEAVAE